MATFLLVSFLTIAFVLGSAMAMRPTPRQRQLARLRQLALAEGLRVQIRPGERELDYALPWRIGDLEVARTLRLDAERDPGGAWRLDLRGAGAGEAALAALDSLPAGIRRVAAGAEGLAVRWDETGPDTEVARIAAALRALREACCPRA